MDALDYLFSLEPFGIKLGLENIDRLLESLGHPERAFRSVHVAGTNGKGSVTAMVDASLRAAGYRSARYTSPHLVDLSERFVIDGRPVAAGELRDAIGVVRDQIEALRRSGTLLVQPTFFEATTALAFELFRRARTEVAVIEVGLGGRLDSTNVIRPMVSAITSISLDHEQHLGRTLAAIAREKAGIIKARVPVVVGRLDREAEHAIEQVATQCGAEVIRAWDGVTIEEILPQKTAEISSGTQVRLRTPARDYGELNIALPGRHQIGNALIAVRLLELLRREGFEVPERAIADGLANPAWPGRLEHRCLPDGREAILDAAHNPAGAAALAAYLTELSTAKLPIVFAAMRDKDVDGMFEALTPVASVLVLTRASNARSADPETLARHAAAIAPTLSVIVQPSREAALRTAWSHSPRIVIAGSIFLLGDVMKEINWS